MAPVVEAAAARKEEVMQYQKAKDPKDEMLVKIARDEENKAPAKDEVVQNEEEGEKKITTKDGVVQNEKEEEEEKNVATETEPKTGISFLIRLQGGMRLNAVGMRKKTMLGLGVKIYAVGIHAAQMH